MIGIFASVALGGVLIKGIAKLSAEKGFSFGAKRMIGHLREKNRGKDTKFSKFLDRMIGVSNEDLARLIEQRTEEIKEGLAGGGQHPDEVTEGLVEMTRQVQQMIADYKTLDHDDREFIQSLKDGVNPDTLALEVVETMKRYQGEGLKVEDITSEIETLLTGLGWNEKITELQTSLDGMGEDVRKILNRTGKMAGDLHDIKGKLEGDTLGKRKTKIAESVMTRSNVITAGGDVMNISSGGKYIGDGAVNIEGENVNYTNIDAKALSRNDWKDVLTNAIKDFGIGDDLESDLSSFNEGRRETYSDLAVKFKEVDSLYDNMEMDSDVFLRMGNALYLSGDYKRSYDCYMRALKEKHTAARANLAFMFSDKNFRDRLLREVGKAAGRIQLSLKELYRSNDLRTYRTVKTIYDELTMFETDVKASVEGIVRERERAGSTGGIDQERYGDIAAFYGEIYGMMNGIAEKTEKILDLLLSGDASPVGALAAPLRAEVQGLKTRYSDRMSIIKEVN